MSDVQITVEGLDTLVAKLAKLEPRSRGRIVNGALRQAAETVANEGNRQVHSPLGHARTFRVDVRGTRAYVGPGSRANFFSQLRFPVMDSTLRATHERVEQVIGDAVEAGVREALR